MDAVLEVLGVRTREHVTPGGMDSLQQWTAVQQSSLADTAAAAAQSTSATVVSPSTDSALGDDVEEGIEATDYVESTSDEVVTE